MSNIVADKLNKHFGGHHQVSAMKDVSFEVNDGELLVLLGPSGCGKTTTLRCLAGLEELDTGSIAFGDQVIFDSANKINRPVHKRDIGLVFQSFAVWPHLTASENIEFPLRTRKVGRAERRARAVEIGRLVDLDDSVLAKRPGQLSGGQQQRVALARALVANPKVMLFDEPLSNLDALLREQLRGDLRLMHQRLGFTGVYVTHDLTEAVALGDRVAVMRAGQIEQLGTPREVFETPATREVARLLGSRRLSTFVSQDGVWSAEEGRSTGESPSNDSAPGWLEVFARPENMSVRADSATRENVISVFGAVVRQVAYLGDSSEIILDLDGRRLHIPGDKSTSTLRPGTSVTIAVNRADARLYDRDGLLWAPDGKQGRPSELLHRL